MAVTISRDPSHLILTPFISEGSVMTEGDTSNTKFDSSHGRYPLACRKQARSEGLVEGLNARCLYSTPLGHVESELGTSYIVEMIERRRKRWQDRLACIYLEPVCKLGKFISGLKAG
jgi:hypothetical protein